MNTIGGRGISSSLRNLTRSISASQPKARKPPPFSQFKNDLNKLNEKFTRNADKGAFPTKSFDHASQVPFSLRAFSTKSSGTTSRGPFHQIAGTYDGEIGKLRNYENAKVTNAASAVSWAERNGLLPREANSILDIGAAQGGAVVRLGKHYQNASILALDVDPKSAAFINDKIKSDTNKSPLGNPERVSTYTGTLPQAISEGKCGKNSVNLVTMQAVAPYMSDDQLNETLKGIHSTLAPGGQLILSGYGENHYYNKSTGKNINLRTDIAMYDMLVDAGFTVKCVGNMLANERGPNEKITHDMDDLLRQKSLPSHPEGEYWHSINIIAIKD